MRLCKHCGHLEEEHVTGLYDWTFGKYYNACRGKTIRIENGKPIEGPCYVLGKRWEPLFCERFEAETLVPAADPA